MPIIDRISEFADEIIDWRHDFHRNPELLYDVHRTARIVEQKLRMFGVDVVETGIGRSGVVGVIKGHHPSQGKVIGLRADMDALPIQEATNKPCSSQTPGLMHACGHDGHTAMLLGAARYLAETRNFAGDAVVIFQPAEEGGAGAKAMIDDNLMERFKIQEVYGLHNHVGLDVGEFAIRPGPLMASADWIDIEIEGIAGHAAKPHNCIDPVFVAGHMLMAINTIVARNSDPLDAVVVSITKIQAGNAYNVIPQFATLHGTARTLCPQLRNTVEERLRNIVEMTASSFGAKAKLTYCRDYPVLVNHTEQTEFASRVAAQISGVERVNTNIAPELGSEDFAFMLEARPGAFIFAGNGDSAGHHHPEYDFNDDLVPVGSSYWAKLVEMAMPAPQG